MSEIEIINAKKIYHDVPVIENLNITIPKGSLFTLLGASGCGKTTLLRMIAGFNSIKDGEFYFDDTKINNMEPSKRNIGLVFQNYAIFPHLTVRDIVAFGLKQKKVPKEELIQQTNKYLELMQIAQYADRKPDKLSGGQQQRVALAHALAVNPSVLLMDEPLSNLEGRPTSLEYASSHPRNPTRSGNYNCLCNPRPRRSHGYFRPNCCYERWGDPTNRPTKRTLS